jgi:hypothetical protein
LALAARRKPDPTPPPIPYQNQLEVQPFLPRIGIQASPFCFFPGQDPLKYLFIQEAVTRREANKWNGVIFDSGADVTLVSRGFAERNGLQIVQSDVAINSADGSATQTAAKLKYPLELFLNRGSRHPAGAVTLAYVMDNVEHLYDVIISTDVIMQWSAFVDPSTGLLHYRPNRPADGAAPMSKLMPRHTLPMLMGRIFDRGLYKKHLGFEPPPCPIKDLPIYR